MLMADDWADGDLAARGIGKRLWTVSDKCTQERTKTLCGSVKCDAPSDTFAAVSALGSLLIPDYAVDCHTLKGKRADRTKADFLREEQRGLKPSQPALFDDLPGS